VSISVLLFPFPLSSCGGIDSILFSARATLLEGFLGRIITWCDEIFTVRFCTLEMYRVLIFHVGNREFRSTCLVRGHEKF
jgi:hypothetical protein